MEMILVSQFNHSTVPNQNLPLRFLACDLYGYAWHIRNPF